MDDYGAEVLCRTKVLFESRPVRPFLLPLHDTHGYGKLARATAQVICFNVACIPTNGVLTTEEFQQAKAKLLW